ncbi:CDP-glycerol glycerophosphotransferase family protein [Enterococcus olivae]
MDTILSNKKRTNLSLTLDSLKLAALHIFVTHLKIIYFVFKLFPSKNQVVFISRQSDTPSIDFEMIIGELKKDSLEVVVLCKQMEKSKLGYLKYYFHILKQSFVLARSRVCIIDTYIIPVSVLKHKKSLKIIQIWHAIGKIKKSGYQTLGKKGGRDEALSRGLKMHRNYDFIIAGAEYWNPFYCASFDVMEDKLKNFGLPRMDYLLEKKEPLKQEILSQYPHLCNGKKNIVYAPTFRRTRAVDVNEFVKNFHHDKFNLIVKLHPHDPHREVIEDEQVQIIEDYTATQLLSLADYLVTDYSSIAFEAALIDLKTFFYVNDYDLYMNENGLNLDLKKESPTIVASDAQALHAALNSEVYDFEAFKRFKKLVLPEELGNATNNIVTLIKEMLAYMEQA